MSANVPAAKDDKVAPSHVERVALVNMHGVATFHDSEEDAWAAWGADSSHVLTVKVPRKDDE